MRPIPRGAVPAQQALAIGVLLAIVSIAALGDPDEPARGRAAGADHRDLYSFALHHRSLKRTDPAQHSSIGGAGGRAAAGDRLGGGDEQPVGRRDRALPPHFLMDAAAFLGAGALPQPRLPAGRRADAARRRRSRRDMPANRHLCAPARAGVARSARPSRASGSLYGLVAVACDAFLLQRAFALYRLREGEELPRRKAAMALFGYSILYMFLLFAALLAQVLVRG